MSSFPAPEPGTDEFVDIEQFRRPTKPPGRGEGRVILDAHDPIGIARAIVAAKFTSADLPTLHHHRGAFWVWRRSFYSLVEDEDIRAEIWTFLEHADRLDDRGNPLAFKPTRARVSDVLDAMGAACNLDARIEPPAWLGNKGSEQPAPGEFLSVANGLLHLSAGELYTHTPRYFGLSASDVAFDRAAPPPRKWLGFLRDLFGDDRDAVAALQDWFGYTLAPDTSQHKILLVVGPLRSGKGTIARVLTGLVGRDSVAGPTLASLSSNFGLEPLIGKPLAIISDARLGSRSDQAAIAERLLSISGEDALTIDRKFRRAWHGRLTTRFMLLTNELPRLVDASGALTKRFVLLTLENSFYGREDRLLTSQLLAELPGILNWALEGYGRLRQRGYFIQPESARDAVEDLEALSSPVTAFVRDRCRRGPGLRCSIDDLYRNWQDWCVANGSRDAGTKQTFGRDFRAAFPSLKDTRPRQGGQRVRFYEGIAPI